MLDRYSEIIAHFIGLFGQDTEQGLMRQQYDAFRAAQRDTEDTPPPLEIRLTIASDLAPDSYIAGKPGYASLGEAARPGDGPPVLWSGPLPQAGNGFDLALELGHATKAFHGFAPLQIELGPVTIITDPPGGLGVVAIERNVAWDNDTLLYRPLELPDDLAASRTPEALDAGLAELKAIASALTPVDFTGQADTTATAEKIDELEAAFAAVDPEAAPHGATVTIVSAGAGTLPETGILIDGTAADALPDRLEQLLEARKAADDAETDDPTDNPYAVEASEDPETGVITGQFVNSPEAGGPFVGAPQQIDTGGNFVMNAAQGILAPVDAGVIVVGGAAHSLTAITQINVMRDRDTLTEEPNPLAAGGTPADGPAASEGHNLAAVTHVEQSWDAGAFGGGERIGYALAEIEGDLTVTSYITQVNFICDNDVVTFETGYYGIEIGTGDNELVNLLSQIGLSGGFDMILVGGDLLNLVTISQLNLLFDNDLVVDGEGAGGTVATAGNLLWNQAEVIWHGTDSEVEMSEAGAGALDGLRSGEFDPNALAEEALLEGREVPMLLTVSGNLVLDYRLEQINIVADADTVQLFVAEAAQNGLHPVEVSTGGNLLANAAKLDIHGTDSALMAQNGVYSDVVIYQAGMYDTDETPLEAAAPGLAGGLATEAVAFLADGMIDGTGNPLDTEGNTAVIIDGAANSGAFDTLGSMVS